MSDSSLRKLLENVPRDGSSNPRSAPPVRWGVAGPGRIASSFVTALQTHTRQIVGAIGSRQIDRAAAFGTAHGIESAHGSYDALVNDPRIDVIYVAVPNSAHLEVALKAIHSGKHLLVEKPFGVDAAEAGLIRDEARAAGVFAMEGLWSRFLPQFRVLESLLESGVLGEIKLVSADFGECFKQADEPSVFNPLMAGGALRDIGIYPAWFAHFVLGAPVGITAIGSLTESGVDAQSAVTLEYSGGALAQLSTSLLARSPSSASISGTHGHVVFDSPFLMPGGFTVTTGSERFVWEDTSGVRELDGLAWEAAAVAQHIADGLFESPMHDLDTTIAISSVLDESRRQLGAP